MEAKLNAKDSTNISSKDTQVYVVKFSTIINILFIILTVTIISSLFMDTIILQLMSLFTTLCIYFVITFIVNYLCIDNTRKANEIKSLKSQQKSEPISKKDVDDNQLSLF